MLRIVICEDNDEYRQFIADSIDALIKEKQIDAAIVLAAASPWQVQEFTANHNANVFFLDIDLNADLNGLDLADIIHKKNDDSYIVFISQYTNLVFKSFKVRPFDFLPKPVSRKELEAVLIDINEAYQKKRNLGQPEIISIKIGSNIFQLPKDKIIYLEQYGNKCIIHTTTQTVYCYQSLETICERLANDAFIRCHKSYIVNRNYIEQTDLAGMSITLTNGQQCFIGGKYKKELVKKLAQ